MRTRIVPLAILVAVFLAPRGVNAQVDQGAVAAQLLSSDVDARSNAVAIADRLEKERIGPELRAALIEALGHENRIREQRRFAERRGEPLAELQAPELYSRIARLMVALGDPDALVGDRSRDRVKGCGAPQHRRVVGK